MPGRKTFILETNVLLHNPQALFSFGDNKVVVTMTVIAELDRFKQGNEEINRNARGIIRELDKLRMKNQGNLADGVALPSGGLLQLVMSTPDKGFPGIDKHLVSNNLLVANMLKQQGERVIIVTKDLGTRIKADALGVESNDYFTDRVDIDKLYPGYRTMMVSTQALEKYREEGRYLLPDDHDLLPNEFVVFRTEENPADYALGKHRPDSKNIVPLLHEKEEIYGVSARNIQQSMAIELLLNDQISMVSLVGTAGTGKTLLALACGLRKIIDDYRYLKMLVSRPIMPIGNDIGYLPGDKDQKLGHWMQPIFDNIDFLMNNSETSTRETISKFLDSNMIELEALTYMRGRSIPRQFIIIDEAQNLTPHEIKTIISRVGNKTKIILTGDPYQIDNPYLDANTNGLSYVIERCKNQAMVGHVSLHKSERSALASLAVDLL